MIYRREVDGLRAIAVVPVILFHAGFQTFGGGFVGVDVFFVISGYLITSLILADLEQGKFSLVGFYERRARRILPALFLVMLVCLPFAWAWLLPVVMKDFSQSLVAVSVFASNIWFWRESGYFDTAAELKPLLHTWSLAVEEQYYVIFPLLLMLLWRLGRSWVLIVLGAAFVGSLALAQWASYAEPTAAFYLLPTRGWELLVGAFAAIYLSKVGPMKATGIGGEVAGWAGVALILYAVFFYSEATPFPGLYALVPTLGAVLVILFATEDTTVGRVVGNRAFVGVGLISYSAYLWHQPLFAFLKHGDFPESPAIYLGLIVATFGLAFLTWKYVETPFRNRRGFRRSTIFVLSAVFMAFFIGIGALGHKTHGFDERAHMLKFADLAYDNTKQGYVRCDNVLSNAAPTLDYCYGTAAPATALVIGDSHADDRFYGVEQAIAGYDWTLIGNPSCPPVMGLRFKSADGIDCTDKLAKLFGYLEDQAGLKLAVLSFAHVYPLDSLIAADHVQAGYDPLDAVIEDPANPALDRVEAFYAGLARTVEFLSSRKIKVVLFVDIPELSYFPADCLKGKVACTVTRSDVLERQKIMRARLAALADPAKGVFVFDTLDVFCDGGDETCSILKEGRILYRDSHHLGHFGSLEFGKVFAKWFAATVR